MNEEDTPGRTASQVFSGMLEAASRLAAQGHYPQFRKRNPGDADCQHAGVGLDVGCVPYVTHLIGTMCILARLGARDEVLAAALLHDYLEDVPDPDGAASIRNAAGPEVLELVLAVTENKRRELENSATWDTRKREQIAHIATMSDDAVLIKAADLLHNLLSLVDDLDSATDRGSVWNRFNAGSERQLWYFEAASAALERRLGDHPIVNQLGLELARLRLHVGQP
jgi:(p)ppGpp synthase/HD superfamily hydrolase